ncbi:hypothetical protein Cni_G20799 [Canna indica]|uniref:NAC domain-containing protein n=1 Tax=Canna indica TaxID=4628 RepID=A0AAQ3KPR9_9LILI|nr:hypothetical protein Cni_G20799 [Canna indica]
MGDVQWDSIIGEDVNEQGLPPGFRFHPTDEELVTLYLASKVFNGGFFGIDIVEVDLHRCEPWELPEVARMGEREWYFFSLRDRKYPTGLRTNRATGAGYWKATGKDRQVHSATSGALVGKKKTLVFYKGRAPRGQKTKWVLHEYRLDGQYSIRHTSCQEEWVICRIFHKPAGDKKKNHDYYYPNNTLSSSSSNPCLPPFLDNNPNIHGLLPPNCNISSHNEANSLFIPQLPSDLGGHENQGKFLAQQQEQETLTISTWFDHYLQNSLFYDMGVLMPTFGQDLPNPLVENLDD